MPIIIDPLGAASVDDRGMRKHRATHAGDRVEALAQVRQREYKDVVAGVSRLDGVRVVDG